MDYNNILDKFYPGATMLRDILFVHSENVANLALRISEAHPELHADAEFVYKAAMLHDIGIFMCNAPGIECHGCEPYIRHGVIGAELLRQYARDNKIAPSDMEPYARVCERHTGTGLRKDDILQQDLPLPAKDLTPETIEEQIICYADKFFSKTHPERQKTYEHAEKSLMKFGEKGVEKFREWHKAFAFSL